MKGGTPECLHSETKQAGTVLPLGGPSQPVDVERVLPPEIQGGFGRFYV